MLPFTGFQSKGVFGSRTSWLIARNDCVPTFRVSSTPPRPMVHTFYIPPSFRRATVPRGYSHRRVISRSRACTQFARWLSRASLKYDGDRAQLPREARVRVNFHGLRPARDTSSRKRRGTGLHEGTRSYGVQASRVTPKHPAFSEIFTTKCLKTVRISSGQSHKIWILAECVQNRRN